VLLQLGPLRRRALQGSPRSRGSASASEACSNGVAVVPGLQALEVAYPLAVSEWRGDFELAERVGLPLATVDSQHKKTGSKAGVALVTAA
jgi:hypothetical protein